MLSLPGIHLPPGSTEKEKHTIPVKQRLPVYIRYFTCEGKDGKILFYDDIYGEDKDLQEKFFAGK